MYLRRNGFLNPLILMLVLGKDMSRHFNSFKVADLFDQGSRVWRMPLVSMLFPGEIAQKILEVYVPISNVEDDVVVWEHSNSGVFPVKSAYLFQFSKSHSQVLEKVGGLFGLWGRIWGLGASNVLVYLEGLAPDFSCEGCSVEAECEC